MGAVSISLLEWEKSPLCRFVGVCNEIEEKPDMTFFFFFAFRTEDPHFIGSADTYWAHWALYNENEHPHQVSAVYVHILEETAGGKLHVAQLNLYAALAPEVEVMVLAVMEGIEKLRGPKGYLPPSSSGSPGGGEQDMSFPSFVLCSC